MLSTSCDRFHPDGVSHNQDESYLQHQENTMNLLSPKQHLILASHRGKPSPVMLDDYPTSVEGGNSPRSHAVMHTHHHHVLKQEKLRRRKLSRLYTEQATMNEQLREENESMQAQQRALVRLLQEKDKMIGDGI
jgi:hypothetical protein